MLKTFRVNDVCKFPNAELYWQAFEYAKSKGVPVYENTYQSDFEIYPSIRFSDDELSGDGTKNPEQLITIPEFFQNCDNWKECGSKPSEGEYIRYGAKVKVRDKNDEDWKIGYRYLVYRGQGQYRHLVLRDGDFNTFQYCELDETPEQTERQKQIAELETKMEELHEQIKKLKDADAN
jgi:hypothetical protein